jgi:hypothetical protein
MNNNNDFFITKRWQLSTISLLSCFLATFFFISQTHGLKREQNKVLEQMLKL